MLYILKEDMRSPKLFSCLFVNKKKTQLAKHLFLVYLFLYFTQTLIYVFLKSVSEQCGRICHGDPFQSVYK